MPQIRRYSQLGQFGKDAVKAVFPDAYDGDGYLYAFGQPKRRRIVNGQVLSAEPRAAIAHCS